MGFICTRAGLHNNLRQMQSLLLDGDEFTALEKFAGIEGLSAYYNPDQIRQEIGAELQRMGVARICDRTGTDLATDTEADWRCSACGYHIGNFE